MKVTEGVTRTTWKTIGLARLAFPLGFLGLSQLFGLTVLVDLSGDLINQTLLNTVLGTLAPLAGAMFQLGFVLSGP